MLKKFDHVSFEHVCSGIGIPNIYGYLRDVERIPETAEVAALIASGGDPSFVIINHAFDTASPSKLCAETIEMFVSILASEAANLAIKVLATGGVYIAGGVVVHTMAALQKPGFMRSFKRKGRFAELMERIPIHVVVSQAGLAGAAAYGLENSNGQ
jgi:glucokinase